MVRKTTQSRDYQAAEIIGHEPNVSSGWRSKVGMLRGMSPALARTLAGVLTMLIFGLDYYLPGDINPAGFYACVLVVLTWTRSARWLWGGAAVVAVLAIIGMAAGTLPIGHPHFNWIDWTNRCITVGMLIVITGFVHIGVRLSRQLDASEQLLAEAAARERAEETLRERNARIRQLVESNLIGIFFWDSGGRITEANDAFLQTVGYSRHDLLSGQFQWTDLTAPEFRTADLRAIDDLRRTGNFTPFEKEYIRKDGSRIPVLLGGTFFEDSLEEGVAFVLDLTERIRAQEMLRRLQADFAHAARISVLGELTASIVHELTQPLAAIATNGEAGLRWLDQQVPNVAEARATSRRMVAEARRCADVIGRIRGMAVRQAPEHTLVSLDALIVEALVFLRPEVQSRGVTVSHQLAPGAPKVLADRVQFQQVIVNLAINAMQAMAQAGSPERRIIIRTAIQDAATLYCAVEDSGPGIAPEHLNSIFESFFTTKENGMGMGLSICRSIIEAHRGRIMADNESAHGGACLYFTLPAADAIGWAEQAMPMPAFALS